MWLKCQLFTEDFDVPADYSLTDAQITGGTLSLTGTGETAGTGSATKVADADSGTGRIGSVTLTRTETTLNVANVHRFHPTGQGASEISASTITKSPIHKVTLAENFAHAQTYTFQASRDGRNYYTVTVGVEFDFETAGVADFVDTGFTADATLKTLRTRVVY